VPTKKRSDDSMKTVILALAVNIAVGVIKAIAGVLAASAGLLAEAAHSVADCTTELFLVTALRRADKPADKRHPFGYGKERYFWSLLAAVTIFVVGAGFSAFQGVTTIINGESDTAAPYIGYIVLALSAVVEGISLRQAYARVRREAARTSQQLHSYVREPDDPTVKSVLLEDSAAIIGLVLAALGLLLRQITGNDLWDGIAALAIAALLIGVAFELARTNMGLLIGKQANPDLVAEIESVLSEQDDILAVVEVRTMLVGTSKVLVCARVDFSDSVSATEAEAATVRLHDVLSERFAEVEDVFIEPVPGGDAGVREDARQRSVTAD
jgi:cation diffusion facilitator family transporter